MAFAARHLIRTLINHDLSVFIEEVVAECARLFQIGTFIVGVVIEPGDGPGTGRFKALAEYGGQGGTVGEEGYYKK